MMSAYNVVHMSALSRPVHDIYNHETCASSCLQRDRFFSPHVVTAKLVCVVSRSDYESFHTDDGESVQPAASVGKVSRAQWEVVDRGGY